MLLQRVFFDADDSRDFSRVFSAVPRSKTAFLLFSVNVTFLLPICCIFFSINARSSAVTGTRRTNYYHGKHPALFQTYTKKFKRNSRRILEKLRILVYNVFCIIVLTGKGQHMKGYLSIQETSYKWGVSERRVNQYISQGRIPGAERFGHSWAIPDNATKPIDPHKEKGFYSHQAKA